jgi:hypothetical protein
LCGARFDTAEKRWVGIGPYYAMFPSRFADEIIRRYTKAGDLVLDPFAGRGTAVYSAAIQGRIGIGIELNPVGWVYGKAKLNPANQDTVTKRLLQLSETVNRYSLASDCLPEFFHSCFSKNVRQFLLAAREQLNWKRKPTDWTIMGLILVYLHGKRYQSLSNQMRQTKSMSPHYAIRWWKEHDLTPPDLDPVDFMLKRIRWRYAKGRPFVNESQIYLGDCNSVLTKLYRQLINSGRTSIRLLFTSPPYYGVTNYHYDQWIRLWMLGYPPMPNSSLGKNRERFQEQDEYKHLLETTFRKASCLISKDSIIYVRTDSRKFTFNTTVTILKQVFPDKKMIIIKQPIKGTTQTHLFGNYSSKIGEVDLILGS